MFESLTPEAILERVLSRMDTDLQTREGSYAYDQAAPIAFEIWRVLMTLDELVEAFYVNERSGPYLDAHARLFAMSRREGAKAAARMTFRGRDGTVVPAGSLFYAAGAMQFQLTEDVTLKDGAGVGHLLAAEVGAQYNVPAGVIDQIGRAVSGLERFENEAAQGGANPESDGDLFARLDEKRKRPPTSGNAAHYREWALSVNGVGALLMSVDGVLDYEGLTLNGSGENLALDSDQVPLVGEVTLTQCV